MVRLFTFGDAMVFLPAKLSALLSVVLLPASLALAALYWESEVISGPFLIAFAVFECWFSLGSTMLRNVIRLLFGGVFLRLWGGRYGLALMSDVRVLCLALARTSHAESVRQFGG
jgi:hypothetical protein